LSLLIIKFSKMTKSNIAQVIEGDSKLVFVAQKEFYDKVNINHKRWGLIYKGKIDPTFDEVERVSKYFKIPIQNFLSQKN
jgi:hypothetical protein